LRRISYLDVEAGEEVQVSDEQLHSSGTDVALIYKARWRAAHFSWVPGLSGETRA
jgi:hypothetical protein